MSTLKRRPAHTCARTGTQINYSDQKPHLDEPQWTVKEEEVEMDHCACVYRFFSLCVYKFTACACMFKCEAGYA